MIWKFDFLWQKLDLWVYIWIGSKSLLVYTHDSMGIILSLVNRLSARTKLYSDIRNSWSCWYAQQRCMLFMGWGLRVGLGGGAIRTTNQYQGEIRGALKVRWKSSHLFEIVKHRNVLRNTGITTKFSNEYIIEKPKVRTFHISIIFCVEMFWNPFYTILI